MKSVRRVDINFFSELSDLAFLKKKGIFFHLKDLEENPEKFEIFKGKHLKKIKIFSFCLFWVFFKSFSHPKKIFFGSIFYGEESVCDFGDSFRGFRLTKKN